MATGTVKWFNATKRYGFIQPDGGGQNVFVHISAVERAGLRELRDGQKISYEVVADKRSGKSSVDHLQVDNPRPQQSAALARGKLSGFPIVGVMRIEVSSDPRSTHVGAGGVVLAQSSLASPRSSALRVRHELAG
jgi:CspA family cold shock protein